MKLLTTEEERKTKMPAAIQQAGKNLFPLLLLGVT